MQVCTLLQTDNHASTPPLWFLQAGCPSCRPTNSVKALKAVKERKELETTSDTTLLHRVKWEGNRKGKERASMRGLEEKERNGRWQAKIHKNFHGCRGYGDPHVYGYGVGMGMIFHPHRPMRILWGFLINLK